MPDRGPYFAFFPQEWEADERVKLASLREQGRMFRRIQRAVLDGDIGLLKDWPCVGRVVMATGPRPHIPTSIRRAVMERDGYACVSCGSVRELSVDHVDRFRDGGEDTLENLRVLCMPCNRRRG